ncbi:MAG: biopolymer transporter ExbD [Planctomycetes bacterium]|nr:biopolymer transporter ExbD [Planctomycetota bacterium]
MAGGGNAEENPVGINVTALVDIIFCLCLFFMCSLKFRELDGKMDSWLPENKGNKTAMNMNVPMDEIRVLISYDKERRQVQRMFVNRPIVDTPEGDALLQKLIREQSASYRSLGKADTPVIVDAGPAVPWREVVKVMNMCKAENVQKIEFGMGSK